MNNYTNNKRTVVGYRFFLFNTIFFSIGFFVFLDVFFTAFKNSVSHDFVFLQPFFHLF